MSEVIQNTGQDFWRPPALIEPLTEVVQCPPLEFVPEACADCGSEFLVGSRFCHSCGLRRPIPASAITAAQSQSASLLTRNKLWLLGSWTYLSTLAQKISLPHWLQYLHFHEIQRWVGLPTASLVAFIIGLGCVTGAVAVSFFYKASNLAEFQAIQMWRMEWLLAATASFVAGILLKTPSGTGRD